MSDCVVYVRMACDRHAGLKMLAARRRVTVATLVREAIEAHVAYPDDSAHGADVEGPPGRRPPVQP